MTGKDDEYDRQSGYSISPRSSRSTQRCRLCERLLVPKTRGRLECPEHGWGLVVTGPNPEMATGPESEAAA